VIGRVIQTGEPELIEDISEDPNFLSADPEIRSEICVPIFNGEEIFGVVNVESTHEYLLTMDDLRLITMLTDQINIGIRRAYLFAERQENLRREQRINEFAHTINSTLDVPELLATVTRLTVELIGADSGSISIMSDDGLEINRVYNFNDDETLNAFPPRGQGITWSTFQTGKPILLDEYWEHPKALKDWGNSGIHAYMEAPIISNRKSLGTLSVYNRGSAQRFTQRDLSLIESIAQEVAVAIQNARLFDALQRELKERKRVEAEREVMYEDLEAKNAELEKFTYTVSHDLKSPLVTIGGFLGYIEKDLAKGDVARVQHSISRIREAAKKMHQLLDELLELSRIGRLANPSVTVSFGDLAREAIELVEGQLSARQVEVRVDADLPEIRVDRTRMIEVLQNLIVNAIKFMGEQDHPLIEIGVRNKDNQQAFFVKDNGIGIAPEFHERIFGLFNKLDQFSDGTGIGLALVKRIVEVHGGKIWVESEIGKGAAFFFTLAENIKQEKS
jgi:signal transduction histidine kinase